MNHRVCILFAILLWGCFFSHEMQAQSTAKYVDPEEAKNETLINLDEMCRKIDYWAKLEFLRYENGEFKLISYSCYAKYKEFSCYYLYSKTCETNDGDISGKGWCTASEFQKHEYLKSSFSRISEDFMEVSNERKIQMLDSFIHVHKKDYGILNKKDGKKLNAIFHDKTNGFDFIGKKVGYVKSSGKPGEKGYYLCRFRYSFSQEYYQDATLYLFDEQQKIESGGYDAAIVYKGAAHIPIEDVIKTLRHD